jgi:hypothetical protein
MQKLLKHQAGWFGTETKWSNGRESTVNRELDGSIYPI